MHSAEVTTEGPLMSDGPHVSLDEIPPPYSPPLPTTSPYPAPLHVARAAPGTAVEGEDGGAINWRADARIGLDNLLVVVAILLAFPPIATFFEKVEDADRFSKWLGQFYGPFLYPKTPYFILGLSVYVALCITAVRRLGFGELSLAARRGAVFLVVPQLILRTFFDGIGEAIKSTPAIVTAVLVFLFIAKGVSWIHRAISPRGRQMDVERVSM